jgi:hypothetical protein
MIIALIALMVLSLTAVALVRSVDTGTLIIGNFAFKQDATEASSTGAKQAIDWLTKNQGALESDDKANGYYAASWDDLDPTGSSTTAAKPLRLVDWEGDQCKSFSGTFTSCDKSPYPLASKASDLQVNGNNVQWIITRLCKLAGPVDKISNPCLTPGTLSGGGTASDRGELSSGGRISSTYSGPYYRIVIRSKGSRNTVSFTETILHF